jgi:hypothetical protein
MSALQPRAARRDPGPVLVTHPNPHVLKARVRREVARGAMVVRTNVVEVRPGVYGVEVLQLRPARPAWVKPAAVAGGAVLALGGAGVLGWLLLDAVVALVAGVSLGMVCTVAALGWLVFGAGTGRGGGHGCETTVIVRHRH